MVERDALFFVVFFYFRDREREGGKNSERQGDLGEADGEKKVKKQRNVLFGGFI